MLNFSKWQLLFLLENFSEQSLKTFIGHLLAHVFGQTSGAVIYVIG